MKNSLYASFIMFKHFGKVYRSTVCMVGPKSEVYINAPNGDKWPWTTEEYKVLDHPTQDDLDALKEGHAIVLGRLKGGLSDMSLIKTLPRLTYPTVQKLYEMSADAERNAPTSTF